MARLRNPTSQPDFTARLHSPTSQPDFTADFTAGFKPNSWPGFIAGFTARLQSQAFQPSFITHTINALHSPNANCHSSVPLITRISVAHSHASTSGTPRTRQSPISPAFDV